MFSISAASWFIGIQIGAVVGRIYKPQWVIFWALVVAALAGAGLYLVGIANAPLWSVVTLFSIFIFSFGLAITPIQTIALQGHGSEAGTAASVLGVVNSFTAAIGAPLYPLVGSESSANLGITILLAHVIALVFFFVVLRPKSIPELIKETAADPQVS
jgi:DHA1 family bicyclomycin/chloramphenicol resistance-like MFS transporter